MLSGLRKTLLLLLSKKALDKLMDVASVAVEIVEDQDLGPDEKYLRAKEIIKSKMKIHGHQVRDFLINLAVEMAVATMNAEACTVGMAPSTSADSK